MTHGPLFFGEILFPACDFLAFHPVFVVVVTVGSPAVIPLMHLDQPVGEKASNPNRVFPIA